MTDRGCSSESNIESNARLGVNFLDDSNMKRVKREGGGRECTPRVKSAHSISRIKLRGNFMRVINVARPRPLGNDALQGVPGRLCICVPESPCIRRATIDRHAVGRF